MAPTKQQTRARAPCCLEGPYWPALQQRSPFVPSVAPPSPRTRFHHNRRVPAKGQHCQPCRPARPRPAACSARAGPGRGLRCLRRRPCRGRGWHLSQLPGHGLPAGRRAPGMVGGVGGEEPEGGGPQPRVSAPGGRKEEGGRRRRRDVTGRSLPRPSAARVVPLSLPLAPEGPRQSRRDGQPAGARIVRGRE
jgi:hypothetical protein